MQKIIQISYEDISVTYNPVGINDIQAMGQVQYVQAAPVHIAPFVVCITDCGMASATIRFQLRTTTRSASRA